METADVLARARSGSRLLLVRRGAAVLIGVASTAVIPRLVSPQAFGVAAVSAIVLSFAETFKDLGMTTALLRKGEVVPEEISFLFWANAAMTILVASLIALGAPSIAALFHAQDAQSVLLWSLPGFIASGLALQHRGLLIRDLDFDIVARIDTTALMIQFLTALTLALQGAGVWALVISNLVASLSSSGLYVYAARWWPQRPQLVPGAGEAFSFGVNTAIYSAANFLSINIAPTLIGHGFGAFVLGQYNRANAVVSLPVTNLVEPLVQAALPALTRLRSQPVVYRRVYISLVERLNIVIVPFATLLLFAAVPLVEAVLGARWALAGRLAPWLAPAIAMTGIGFSVSDLLVSQNRSRDMRRLGLLDVAVRSLSVAGGLHWGPVGGAAGYSAGTVLMVFLRVHAAGKGGLVTIRHHLQALAPALPVALGVTLGCQIGAYLSLKLAAGAALAALLIVAWGGLVGLAMSAAFAEPRRVLLGLLSDLGRQQLSRAFSSATRVGLREAVRRL